jgi:hypothetical protein
MRNLLPLLVTLLAIGVVSPAEAQQTSWQANAPIKRTPLQKFDVPSTNYEMVVGIAEIARM